MDQYMEKTDTREEEQLTLDQYLQESQMSQNHEINFSEPVNPRSGDKDIKRDEAWRISFGDKPW